MRLIFATLALAGAMLAARAPAHAQTAADDRYPSWSNRMRGYEPVREWRWPKAHRGRLPAGSGDLASRYDCKQPGQCSRSKRTASGEQFVASGLTFAHRSLPFGTRLRFTFAGKSVVCRCNDRGPFVRGRTYDLAAGCADAIRMHGVARVKAERA